MRYWWVNQNQTYQQETRGGYLWSPKVKNNGHRNPFYEFMREVSPNDLIFSFKDTYIKAIGIASSHAYESPKPLEFGNTGAYWDQIGWRVDTNFHFLKNQIRPVDNLSTLLPVFPQKYSPLQQNGNGNQGVYLTELPILFAERLMYLIGEEAKFLKNAINQINDSSNVKDTALGLVEWEEHLLNDVQNNTDITDTERTSIVLARRGQGKFKEDVLRHETSCRITRVDRIEHLRASHIKPWRDCDSGDERLNGNNGLLLTPSIDHLFDRGFISFEDTGSLIISPVADEKSLSKMGVKIETQFDTGSFNEDQKYYLDYHRNKVFLQARVNK